MPAQFLQGQAECFVKIVAVALQSRLIGNSIVQRQVALPKIFWQCTKGSMLSVNNDDLSPHQLVLQCSFF